MWQIFEKMLIAELIFICFDFLDINFENIKISVDSFK